MADVGCGFHEATGGAGCKRALTDAGSADETGGGAGFDGETASCDEKTGDSDDEAAGASLTGADGINDGRMASDKAFDKLASFNASVLGRSETDSNNFT
ncbi:hypothetical protein MTO96_047596 [Rhipicephalus appendiculatus]